MADHGDRVLKLVGEPDYKPITLKAMSRRLKVEADDYAEFRAAVKALVKEASSSWPGTRPCSKPDRTGAIIGLFRRSSKGFGFVRPHTADGRADQIYIPPEAAGDASSGDEVVVKITKRPKRAGDERRGADRPDPGPGLGAVRGDLLRGRRRPATSRSTAPRSTPRSTWETPGPRGPSRATRSPSRSSATRPPTRKGRG